MMPSGIVGYLLFKQAQFYREMTGLIRAAKSDGSAVATLFGIAFLYGIFHAAGPGHGKAVISSYMIANRETWRRGVILSFAAALVQALTAIVLVGIAAVLLNATARTMNSTVHVIEIAAYAMVIVIGLRLLWIKGLALVRALRGAPSADAHDDPVVAAAVPHALSAQAVPVSAHDDHADHDHAHHDHSHHDQSCCAHDHDHSAHTHHHDHTAHNPAHGETGHVHDDSCGHAHGPDPSELAGPGGWRRGMAAVLACGLRPCSGAIIVLVFALSQGLFWAGVGATFMMGLGTAITVTGIATIAVAARGFADRLAHSRSGGGLVFLRVVEVAAALVIVCFGVLLLTGYIVEERMLGA
jgi:ABC-type nickel/cobalt efflux system permease component RcnA